jgi:hypothetical protein
MKIWKLALSLALIAAIATPFLTGTWRLHHGQWVALTYDQRERVSAMLQETRNCTSFPKEEEYRSAICTVMRSVLVDGGSWQTGEKIGWRYLARNAAVMVAAFILVFVVTLVLVPTARRYWRWLNR